MDNYINLKDIKGIKFCDYIEVEDTNNDIYLYNIYHSNEYGFCLAGEDEPLIKFIHINNSILESYYVTGEVQTKPLEIKSIKIDSHWIEKKIKGFSVEGTLLQYNDEMGKKYNLNSEEHYNKYHTSYENNIKIKRRKKEEY